VSNTTEQKTKPGRKANKLTPAEVTFLKELAKGSTQQAAAQTAWPNQTYQSAAVSAHETLKKPKIQEALQKSYEKAGLTPDSITKVLTDAMKANKTASFGGMVLPSLEPDHSVRVAAARAAAQLVSAGDNGKGPDGPTINFNLGTQNYVKNVEVKPQQT
jgi:hypothetical protein